MRKRSPVNDPVDPVDGELFFSGGKPDANFKLVREEKMMIPAQFPDARPKSFDGKRERYNPLMPGKIGFIQHDRLSIFR